jgi:hypothetical protein
MFEYITEGEVLGVLCEDLYNSFTKAEAQKAREKNRSL